MNVTYCTNTSWKVFGWWSTLNYISYWMDDRRTGDNAERNRKFECVPTRKVQTGRGVSQASYPVGIGDKAARDFTHAQPVPRWWINGAIGLPSPTCIFMTWCLRKYREIFTILPWRYSPFVIINNYSNKHMHIKRLKSVHDMKILHVSAPRLLFQGIQSTKAFKCQHCANSNTTFLVLARLCILDSLKKTLRRWNIQEFYMSCMVFSHFICICWLL